MLSRSNGRNSPRPGLRDDIGNTSYPDPQQRMATVQVRNILRTEQIERCANGSQRTPSTTAQAISTAMTSPSRDPLPPSGLTPNHRPIQSICRPLPTRSLLSARHGHGPFASPQPGADGRSIRLCGVARIHPGIHGSRRRTSRVSGRFFDREAHRHRLVRVRSRRRALVRKYRREESTAAHGRMTSWAIASNTG